MNHKIYIVDDNAIMRVFLSNLLKKFGVVHAFTDGEELLNALEKGGAPAIIILDLNLPGIQGIELLDKIQSDHKHLNPKIFVVSGVDNSEERIKCLSKGAMDFISKPFHPKELEYKVINGLSMSYIH